MTWLLSWRITSGLIHNCSLDPNTDTLGLNHRFMGFEINPYTGKESQYITPRNGCIILFGSDPKWCCIYKLWYEVLLHLLIDCLSLSLESIKWQWRSPDVNRSLLGSLPQNFLIHFSYIHKVLRKPLEEMQKFVLNLLLLRVTWTSCYIGLYFNYTLL